MSLVHQQISKCTMKEPFNQFLVHNKHDEPWRGFMEMHFLSFDSMENNAQSNGLT